MSQGLYVLTASLNLFCVMTRAVGAGVLRMRKNIPHECAIRLNDSLTSA